MKFSYQDLQDLSSVSGGHFRTSSYDDAVKFCENLAKSHYENFPVASLLVKKDKRRHIVAVYTFARIADDIADENINIPADKRNELLQQFADNYKHNKTTNPIFLALNRTIDTFSLSYEPFDKLLSAFHRDIYFEQAKTVAELYDYCSYSANPIGELVLRIYGAYTPETELLSNSICTALQLTNFWQDLSIDSSKNRIFIPLDILAKHNLTNDDILNGRCTDALSACLTELIDITKSEYLKGQNLPAKINDFGLRNELRITLQGGYFVLKKCAALKEKLLITRPKLIKSDIFFILVNMLLGKKIK